MTPTPEQRDPLIVPAEVADLPFLRRMLYEAAFWRAEQDRPPLDDALIQPELAVYLDGWGRHGDVGLIAHIAERPAGAVWVRNFDRDRHGYGYLDDRTPELTLAVAPPYRRRGIGGQLLARLLADPRLWDTARVSLSVEADNPAVSLYEHAGFEVVEEDGGAMTMVRGLGDDRRCPARPTRS